MEASAKVGSFGRLRASEQTWDIGGWAGGQPGQGPSAKHDGTDHGLAGEQMVSNNEVGVIRASSHLAVLSWLTIGRKGSRASGELFYTDSFFLQTSRLCTLR